MSAEPVERERHVGWQLDPMRQKLASYTLEDVLGLPPDAPRVELVNGVILVVPSPSVGHQNIASLLWLWLRNNAPREFAAVQAVGVAVEVNRSYEPDVLLIRANTDQDRHFLSTDEVVIAVEVVSPHTKARDRFAKPAEYAAAGIPFYWRVEQDPLRIFGYRRGADGRYEIAAESTDVLTLDEPFPISLPISEITP